MQHTSIISSKWGWVLMMIVFIDTFSTALQLHLGWVREANPLMNFFVSEGGIMAFCFIKIIIFSSPMLIITEYGVRKNIISREKAGRYYAVATIFYLLLFVIGIIFFNASFFSMLRV